MKKVLSKIRRFFEDRKRKRTKRKRREPLRKKILKIRRDDFKKYAERAYKVKDHMRAFKDAFALDIQTVEQMLTDANLYRRSVIAKLNHCTNVNDKKGIEIFNRSLKNARQFIAELESVKKELELKEN